MSRYDKNLASEFHVMSVLYRLGVDASLTLGNKKAVDILIANGDGRAVTVDVKGVKGRDDWPADNLRRLDDPFHFYVFVSFEGRIEDAGTTPAVWIIPSSEVSPFVKQYRTRTVVSRALLKRQGGKYRSAWKLLAEAEQLES